jgi:hypothetical protein
MPPEYCFSIVVGLIEGPPSVRKWEIQREPFQRAYQYWWFVGLGNVA